MKNKQTALEFLLAELDIAKLIQRENLTIASEVVRQAKAMEKEQIIDAYEYGYWRGNNDDDFEPEEYYKNPYCNPNNETYGTQLPEE
jgi:hypothetical protein